MENYLLKLHASFKQAAPVGFNFVLPPTFGWLTVHLSLYAKYLEPCHTISIVLVSPQTENKIKFAILAIKDFKWQHLDVCWYQIEISKLPVKAGSCFSVIYLLFSLPFLYRALLTVPCWCHVLYLFLCAVLSLSCTRLVDCLTLSRKECFWVYSIPWRPKC